VSEDVVKVVVDNNMGRKKVLEDTGKFTCLRRSQNLIGKPNFHMKFNLEVKGDALKKNSPALADPKASEE
jgi:hypothetical protein